jgi:hypothetical protein
MQNLFTIKRFMSQSMYFKIFNAHNKYCTQVSYNVCGYYQSLLPYKSDWQEQLL